jgi:hypothetical protein
MSAGCTRESRRWLGAVPESGFVCFADVSGNRNARYALTTLPAVTVSV